MSSHFRSALIAAALFITACKGEPTTPEMCLPESTVDAQAPITRFNVHFLAGADLLFLDGEATTTNGAHIKVSKARFYLSELALIGNDGARVPAELVDAEGNRLPHGLTLLDLERPGSLGVYVKAPAGDYQGMAVSVGVPEKCPTGAELNHVDASEMEAPLDVDSDMYWSWNPGYVFLKFEGQVEEDGEWENFFYHVGGDDRFNQLELSLPFTIKPEGGNGPELVADFNRLLVRADGTNHPDITNDDQRRVHSGGLSDVLAENIRHSGFLLLYPAHEN